MVTASELRTLKLSLAAVDAHHESRATELIEIMEERLRKDVGIQSEFHEKNFTRFKERVYARQGPRLT